jgi:hypothetical protein
MRAYGPTTWRLGQRDVPIIARRSLTPDRRQTGVPVIVRQPMTHRRMSVLGVWRTAWSGVQDAAGSDHSTYVDAPGETKVVDNSVVTQSGSPKGQNKS